MSSSVKMILTRLNLLIFIGWREAHGRGWGIPNKKNVPNERGDSQNGTGVSANEPPIHGENVQRGENIILMKFKPHSQDLSLDCRVL